MLNKEKIKELLSYVERKRGAKSIFWQICVLLKDIVWSFYYYGVDSFIRFFYIQKSFRNYKKSEAYHKVSFCITSMDRLCHLKKTLIKNIKNNILYPNVEFILLDYNSKDGLKDWVEKNCKEYLNSGILKYYRIEWPESFNMSNAKNISHTLATGDVLCGLDADNLTNKNFAYYINFEFNKNKEIIGHSSVKISDFGGRMFTSKENFKKLNGYDESFIGWGYEDLDFKHRAFESGLSSVCIPYFFLDCVKHSDKMRDKNMSISKLDSEEINKKLFIEKRERYNPGM